MIASPLDESGPIASTSSYAVQSGLASEGLPDMFFSPPPYLGGVMSGYHEAIDGTLDSAHPLVVLGVHHRCV